MYLFLKRVASIEDDDGQKAIEEQQWTKPQALGIKP